MFGIQVMAWIMNYYLNSEQVKVCYSDVSAIQMFAIQIPTVLQFLDIFNLVYKPKLEYQAENVQNPNKMSGN